jgi:hypothetical protein
MAALLNVASSGASHKLSLDGVIATFQDAYPEDELDEVKDRFEGVNEQGCALN